MKYHMLNEIVKKVKRALKEMIRETSFKTD